MNSLGIGDEQLSKDELELKDKIIKYLESADASKENFEEIVKGYDTKVVIKIERSIFSFQFWVIFNFWVTIII